MVIESLRHDNPEPLVPDWVHLWAGRFSRRHDMTTTHRKLRRTIARLLLLAPALPLAACNGPEYSCEPAGGGSGGQTDVRVFVPERFQFPDGSTPGPDTTCEQLCNALSSYTPGQPCSVEARDSAGVPTELTCRVLFLCEGRRPEGLLSDGSVEGRLSALGDFFARLFHLEAASVPAFERLAEELEAQGAPARLVRAARRSAGDEVRHARAMAELARRYGAPLPEVRVEPFRPRSLEALALENAIEGCVRETFGALVSGWQARTAGDSEVRHVMGPIAEEELRHAELSWAIDAWAARGLDAQARSRVQEARREALRTLEREVEEREPLEELVQVAGLPSREAARQLLRGLAELVLDVGA
jgi:rubrerythrin